MDIKESLNIILEREIDRGDFLKQLAIGVLAIFGITRFVKGLGDHGRKGQAQTSGYGGKINLKDR